MDFNIILRHEGFRFEAYLCPAGVPTIGYGQTRYSDGRKVQMGDKLGSVAEGLAEFEELFEKDFLPALEAIPTFNQMTDRQQTAIASFAYNLGANFYGSTGFNTITKLIDTPEDWSDRETVFSAFGLYVRAGHTVLPGLVTRRKEEAELFYDDIDVSPQTHRDIFLEAVKDTWLKKDPHKQASELSFQGEKSPVKSGRILAAKQLLGYENNHLHVRFKYGLGDWWVYYVNGPERHWDLNPVTALTDVTTPKKLGLNYLKLTRTHQNDQYGCEKLKLTYVRDGVDVDELLCCSGAPSRQVFKKGPDSVPMTLEPIPEGKWYVHNIKWPGGRDNYWGHVFSTPGVGPVTVPVDYVEPGTTRRSAIEIHIDWNRDWSPGTAGCVGIYSIADFQRFVAWLRETDPRDFYVDYGLGSVVLP